MCFLADDWICTEGNGYIFKEQRCDGREDCQRTAGELISSDENAYECAGPGTFLLHSSEGEFHD